MCEGMHGEDILCTGTQWAETLRQARAWCSGRTALAERE